MTNWIDIGEINDIPRQGARVVKTAGGCVAIIRTLEDKIFALEDRCPHKNGPLSEGIVHGDKVTCPLHNWVFDMNTGEALGADEGRVAAYATKVEAGRILLDAEFLQKRSAA